MERQVYYKRTPLLCSAMPCIFFKQPVLRVEMSQKLLSFVEVEAFYAANGARLELNIISLHGSI